MGSNFIPRRPVPPLKEIRQRAGFTQEYLAAQLDYTYPSLSRMERGKDSINLDLAQVWAELCGYELTLVGKEHSQAIQLIASLGPADAEIASRLAQVIPRLAPTHKASLLALLDVWERSVEITPPAVADNRPK